MQARLARKHFPELVAQLDKLFKQELEDITLFGAHVCVGRVGRAADGGVWRRAGFV